MYTYDATDALFPVCRVYKAALREQEGFERVVKVDNEETDYDACCDEGELTDDVFLR